MLANQFNEIIRPQMDWTLKTSMDTPVPMPLKILFASGLVMPYAWAILAKRNKSPRIIMAVFEIWPTVSNRNERIKKKRAFSSRFPCALVIWSIPKSSPKPRFVSVLNLCLPVKKDNTRAKIVSEQAYKRVIIIIPLIALNEWVL